MGYSHSHSWRYYSFKLPYHFQEMWENRGISLWALLLIIPVMTLQRLFVLKIVESSSDSLSETWLNYMNYGCAISKYKELFNKSLNLFSLKMCCNPNIMFQFQLQYTNFQNNFFHTESKVKFHLRFILIHYSFLLRYLCVLRNSEMWNKSLPVEWDHPEPTGKVLLLSHEMQQRPSLDPPSAIYCYEPI